MATKKTAKSTPASKPIATSKSKTAAARVKRLPRKSAPKSSVNKPSRTKKSTPSKQSRGRIIAIVIGIIAAIALIAITISALVTSINQNGKNNMVVETGDGERIETHYLGFNDFSFRLKIPKSFHALTEAEIKDKYKNSIPEVVYANADNTVNIAIDLSDNEVANDDIPTYLTTMKNTILMLQNSTILSSKDSTQGEHNIGTIEFINDSTDGKYYNYTTVFSQNDKLNTVTFNVSDIDRETWQPVAAFVINSLDFTR